MADANAKHEVTTAPRRIRRVEYEAGRGWIARKKDGTEIVHNFRWSTRDVARSVAAEHDELHPEGEAE